MTEISRRRLLATAASGTMMTAAAAWMIPTAGAQAQMPMPMPMPMPGMATTTLMVSRRVIEVGGKPASAYGIQQPDGTYGLYTRSDLYFDVVLQNRLEEPTLVHWHGLLPDYLQDGVPGLSQPALVAGGQYSYRFQLGRPGTYWMHSHLGLQEQGLHAAPLIVRDPAEAGLDEQEVVIILHDFTFRDPHEILEGLHGGEAHDLAAMDGAAMPGMDMNMQGAAMPGMDMAAAQPAVPGMDMPPGTVMPGMDVGAEGAAVPGMDMAAAQPAMPGMDMPGMDMGAMEMDANDVEFDAYLANDRSFADPEVIRVEAGGRVRLRIINAGSSTNFHIDLGGLEGTLVAVDGDPVQPRMVRSVPLAMAQRADIRIALPAGQGAYPVMALREGAPQRTGVVLATSQATISRIADSGDMVSPGLDPMFEMGLRAAAPLAVRPATRTHAIDLTGDMMAYDWGIDGRHYGEHQPLLVRYRERAEITMRNRTQMSHPMHIHGHVFQVVAINGQRFAGAVRDTVLVHPESDVTIAFDADNPGPWVFHCHNLYHMASGMMTTVEYEA